MLPAVALDSDAVREDVPLVVPLAAPEPDPEPLRATVLALAPREPIVDDVGRKLRADDALAAVDIEPEDALWVSWRGGSSPGPPFAANSP